MAKLKALSSGSGMRHVTQCLLEMAKRFLVVMSHEAAVERLVTFYVNFAVELKSENPEDDNGSTCSVLVFGYCMFFVFFFFFVILGCAYGLVSASGFLEQLFNFVLRYIDVDNKAVRYRCCQIIAELNDRLASKSLCVAYAFVSFRLDFLLPLSLSRLFLLPWYLLFFTAWTAARRPWMRLGKSLSSARKIKLPPFESRQLAFPS
jgi:hypothetical protein